MRGRILIFICTTLFLAACTATLPQGDIVFNFCDEKENEYIDCSVIALTTTEIVMDLDLLSSDVASVDAVVYELPNGELCSTDATTLTATDDDTYGVKLACDLSAYEEQNTQLAFTATVTLTDASTVQITGEAEDWVD